MIQIIAKELSAADVGLGAAPPYVVVVGRPRGEQRLVGHVALGPVLEGLPLVGVVQERLAHVDVPESEELGDFKEQIYQHIDTRILESQTYQAISRRFVEAGLME